MSKDETKKLLDLVAEAAELAPEELARFMESLKAMGGVVSANEVEEPTAGEEETYLFLADELSRITGNLPMPYPVFRKTRNWQAFHKACKTSDAFIESLEKDRVKQLAIRKWCCKLVIAHIARTNRPFFWPVVSNALGDLPAIVERQFPGYVASGLISHVISAVLKADK